MSNTAEQDMCSYVMRLMQQREEEPCGPLLGRRAISEIFVWWLWVPDANEEVVRYTFTYNQVQLVGIFLAREMALANSIIHGCVVHDTTAASRARTLCANDMTQTLFTDAVRCAPVMEAPPFIPNGSTPYSGMTLRQFRDTVESIQWQWSTLLARVEQPEQQQQRGVLCLHMDTLFSVFGKFMSTEASAADGFDDDQFTEPTSSGDSRVVHETGVKSFVHLFYILFRSLYLTCNSICIAPEQVQRTHECIQVEAFHVEASLDDFYNASMYFDLAPACLLDYKHTFKGFFNNVSQVVYRHYPDYKRKTQDSVENIAGSKHIPGFDINIIPCLRQLYPEIEYAWEDHHFGSVLCRRTGANNPEKKKRKTEGDAPQHGVTWHWYCIAGTFFLVDASGRVYHSSNVVYLLAYYIQQSQHHN
jgi:hypothetical protein